MVDRVHCALCVFMWICIDSISTVRFQFFIRCALTERESIRLHNAHACLRSCTNSHSDSHLVGGFRSCILWKWLKCILQSCFPPFIHFALVEWHRSSLAHLHFPSSQRSRSLCVCCLPLLPCLCARFGSVCIKFISFLRCVLFPLSHFQHSHQHIHSLTLESSISMAYKLFFIW